jgi:uncharacterized coiled-coil DUF342 family protein
MATLEDAADDLVVKLRGLDSEIEESGQKLEDLRQRLETVSGEVAQEWTALAEAASSFLEKVREEQEQLHQQTQQTLQGVAEAQNAVAQDGAQARAEIADGRTQLDALGQHATGLEPGVASLATEAGEAPAQGLAERARELEQELTRVVEEARDFLRGEVLPAVEEVADDLRDRGRELHRMLANETTAALQQAFDEWESKVDGLEEYVVTQGYHASHQHARDVVEYAADECEAACLQQLDDLQQLVGALLAQLKELAAGVEQTAANLVTQAGAELTQELDRTHTAATDAVAALDRVKQELSAYSFVEV